jgi:Protein kinase domain
MSLSTGDRLGPYEILAPIDAGGMGEVYRARDTKLDRDVAIKVLPAALAQDPERLARFEREAKVLASLNHPYIAQIYGLEQRALVMELVEGETLKGSISIPAKASRCETRAYEAPVPASRRNDGRRPERGGTRSPFRHKQCLATGEARGRRPTSRASAADSVCQAQPDCCIRSVETPGHARRPARKAGA